MAVQASSAIADIEGCCVEKVHISAYQYDRRTLKSSYV